MFLVVPRHKELTSLSKHIVKSGRSIPTQRGSVQVSKGRFPASGGGFSANGGVGVTGVTGVGVCINHDSKIGRGASMGFFAREALCRIRCHARPKRYVS